MRVSTITASLAGLLTMAAAVPIAENTATEITPDLDALLAMDVPLPPAPPVDENTLVTEDQVSENPADLAARTLSKRDNRCGHSSFAGETSGGSPLVRDCEQLRRNIEGDGTWRLSAWNYERDLASYGTCKFVAQSPVSTWAFIGNEDIRDLIRDSISKYQSNGRVGARGLMTCHPSSQTETYNQLVWWWIRHT